MTHEEIVEKVRQLLSLTHSLQDEVDHRDDCITCSDDLSDVEHALRLTLTALARKERYGL